MRVTKTIRTNDGVTEDPDGRFSVTVEEIVYQKMPPGCLWTMALTVLAFVLVVAALI